jgi:hypothetical protein
MHRNFISLTLFCCLLSTLAARAEDRTTIPLRLTPAAKPTPALRYRLFPSPREMQPGSAVAMAYRAVLQVQQARYGQREVLTEMNRLLDLPLADLPLAEAKKVLSPLQSTIQEATRAARREQVNWDLPLREDGVDTLLPEVQEFRELTRILALQARVQMVSGDFAGASQSLATINALAQLVNEAGTLICSLVGVAMTGISSNQALDWIQTPNSPNLYWALTDLPDHPIDIRANIAAEQLFLTATFPHLDAMQNSILSRQQANESWQALGDLLSQAEDSAARSTQALGLSSQATLLLPAFSDYARAKQLLIDAGHSARDVEAMPVAQVLLLNWINQYYDSFDEAAIWLNKPYVQAGPALQQLDQQNADNRATAGPLARLLLPAISTAARAPVRIEQQIAILRTIEAIRLYAATHDGKLPSALSELEVPVPLDPFNGQPFEYHLSEATAMLLPSITPYQDPVRYELSIVSTP